MSIYLDNAATSWPKHPEMLKAMAGYLEDAGGNPGRSGHSLSAAAARVVFETRSLLARLFGVAVVDQVIFTKNATEALNIVLFGFLLSGDHVLTTSVEHNAVMRPLRHLERSGVEITVIPCDNRGYLDVEDLKKAITPKTKLIAMTHASNVIGTILPIAKAGQIAREAGIRLLVDASQTAGMEDIDMERDCIDALAFTGHKSLGGPQGTGGLALRPDFTIQPLIYGGTGSFSESEIQPDFLPDQLESGTINAIGIAGLGASVSWLLSEGLPRIREHKKNLIRQFIEGASNIPGITLYGSSNPVDNAGVVSLNLNGVVRSELGMVLDQAYGILTRTGLHCAPAAHKTIGTFPQGTVRFSVSAFTTTEEIDITLHALRAIAAASSETE